MTPTYPRLLPDRDEVNDWYLDEDVLITLHNGNKILLRKGFKFDSHSVPFWARLAFPRYVKTAHGEPNDIYAAMVHDCLIAGEHWLPYPRRFQDYEYERFHNMPEYFIYSVRAQVMPLFVRGAGMVKYDLWGDYRGEVIDGDITYEIVGATML